MSESDTYEDIRARVEQRFQQRSGLRVHIAVYTLVNIILWLVYGFMNRIAGDHIPFFGMLVPIAFFPWPLIVMAGWGIGLIAHGLNYYMRYGEGAIRRREAIQRAIEREMALSVGYEKPKNDPRMRLTDDGELQMIDEDVPAKRKHS